MRFFLFIFFIISLQICFSQSDKTLRIFKTVEKITIDGKLDEAIWKNCEPAEKFWQNFPYDTSYAQSKTVAFVTYNETALFVAAICYDSLPGNYVIQSLKRDFSYPISDAFVVTLDPFSDQQNGFSFGVNPYGVQREGLISQGGGQGVTTNWDNKWYAEVTRTANAWIIEMEIPFKTLRYESDLTSWRINFARNDLKRNENSTWCKVPRQFNIATLSFTGVMQWDHSPKKAGANVSVIPYAIGKVSKEYVPTNTNTKVTGNIGADAKIALSSALNLDLTVNPDFSQVEVDRQVTNLTRFNLAFPEQRQFFLENSDLFASFGFRQMRPFFSRRIGLGNGSEIPIIAGARLSGKPNQHWRIGIMNIQTAKTKVNNADVFAQNYFVAAVQRNVFKRSNVAFIAVNRQQFDTTNYSAINFNRVLGLDYNLASANNKWQGKLFFHHSLSNKDNNNAFAHASWISYNTQKVSINWNHEYMDKNFNAETGFTPRIFQTNQLTGITTRSTYWRLEPSINYYLYPKKSLINKTGPRTYLDYYANTHYETTDVLWQSGWDIFLKNTAAFSFDYRTFYTRLIQPTDVTFTGITPLAIGQYQYQDVGFTFKTDQRKIINGNANVYYGSYFLGTKLSYYAELVFRKQPYGSIGLAYTHNEITLPNQTSKTQLDLISPKVELSFTRSIFFTAFFQYNSQIHNVNINARFQWRFKPMSDLFIVYTDNYISDNFMPKNKALVVKFVYWLQP